MVKLKLACGHTIEAKWLKPGDQVPPNVWCSYCRARVRT